MLALSRFPCALALIFGLGAACVIAAQGSAGQSRASNITVADNPPDGLRTIVYSASYQATLAQAAVVIGAEVHGLAERPGADMRRLEVRFAVSDGPTAVPERTVTIPLVAEADRKLAFKEGARVLTQFLLAPGTYHMRVSVRDTAGQSAGSVDHTFEAPVLAGENSPIHMSDLALTSSSVGGLTHAEVEGDQRALPVLGRPPTGRREFAHGEQLEVHAEFYEKVTEFGLEQDIFVTTRISSTSGDILWETRDSGTSESMSDGRFGYAHSTLVPISAFAPGTYIVEIEAQTLYGATTFVSRSLPIDIVRAR